MRKSILLAVLLVVLLVVSVSAASPMVAYIGDITSIAWLEGDTLNVALANGAVARSTITISTDTLDSRWRPIFSDTTVTVPGQTIVVVGIEISAPRRGEAINVKLGEYRRTVEVPVQTATIFGGTQYVVPANTSLSFKVDLSFMYEQPRLESLRIDPFYQTVVYRNRGPIQVETFEGGLKYNRSRNTIEYTEPYMVLSMRAPQTNDLEVITFGMTKVLDGFRRNEQEVPGPTILVYGRNYRFASSPSRTDTGSGRITR